MSQPVKIGGKWFEKIDNCGIGLANREWHFGLMKFKRKILLATAASLAIVASTVQAAEIQFDEARFGATWIDMPLPERQSYHEYDFFGLNAEVLFAPVDFEFGQNKSQGFIRGFFTPRPHVGTTVSFNRHTPTSVYTGLTWHHPIGDILFLESSFGAGESPVE